MKNLIALILFFTFFFSSSFSQDDIPAYVENYPGIPLLAATNCFAYDLDNSRLAKLRELGIYGIVAADLHAGDLERIRSFGLKIFPYYIWSEYRSALVTNYTDAYYTLWEAEGKGDGSNGDVELKHSALGELFTEGEVSGIKTINSTPGKLIYGPAYLQEPRYRLIWPNDLDSVIKYRADYRLKVKLNGNPLPWDYMDHVVCTLKVVSLDGYYPTPAEKELYTREVRLSDFPGWDTWDTLSIENYRLDILENLTDQEYIERMISAEHDTTFSVSHMEYQVVWSGLSYLDLYVDNIEVYDEKGRLLVYDPGTRIDIYNYIHNTHAELNDTSITIGWFGSNEPMTIDSYEPFRIVNEIVRQATNDQLRLYTGFTSGWLGWFGGAWPDYVPNGRVFKTSEFMKRTKLPIVHYNAHMYHVPYSLPLYPDYIKLNIEEVVDRNLEKINDLQIPFSYETQSGKFYKLDSLCSDETAFYIVPTPEQMLYHINLGLMSGMKELRCDPFFTLMHETCTDSFYRKGLVEPDGSLSALGYTWRDTVVPRMSGLAGKMIKRLTPTEQYYDLYFDHPYNWINSIYCKYEENGSNSGSSMTLAYDLGFFSQNTQPNVKFFMLVNRWYGSIMPLNIDYTLDTSYVKWKLTNYIDSSKVTKLSQDVIYCSINAGDGILFSLAPVIESGGFLIDNETISGTNTLEDTLIVQDGAKLTVSGTYYVNAPLTVERGAELYLTPGSGMIFSENGSLTVNGILTANGKLDSLITFEFTNSNNGNGIIARDYTSLSLQYCVIKNADAGLQIINSPSSTTKIRYNRFEQCNTAVSAVNSSSLLIQGNTIFNCRMGIFTSQSVNLNIVQNSITSQSYAMPGMFLNSSSGNIRSNVISGHSAGINLANSSPLLGMNSIFNNYDCGVYSGSGSIPDLRLKVSSDVCENPSYYYPLGGVNHIYENGGMINEPYYQGAEIFISYADILLQNGINSIIDDRIADNPPYLTECLFNGQTNDFIIHANGNFWGENPEYPLSERFCSLDVIYEPENDGKLPDYRECELVVYTTDGIAIDTLYPAAEAELTGDIEQLFAQAEQEISEGDYTEAENIYQLIIQNYSDLRTSFPAFARLMMIERITNGDTTAYNNLKNFFLSHLNTISDTLLQKMVRQLANICLVYEGAFQDAISVYEDIIQQNPGSEEALYAEIDLYTIDLLTQAGWLGKGKGSPVTAANFNSKISSLIKQKFGGKAETTATDDIPAEYNLLQNYPNPFNPVTRITYHLPEDGKVSLKVYDILGREVKTLVNEFKSMGKHYAEFNASHLASGVYIYRLEVNSKTFTKKLLLMK